MKPTIIRYCNLAFALIFALAAFWLLGIDGANYLKKIDLLSIFLSTGQYFSDCAALPGGVLTWCATFLTQTFVHPWLGALVYIGLLLPMAWFALDALNSADTESYHSWSSNGRWILFSSRRDDGAFTRLYICYFDRDGRAHKPFMLPQRNPDSNTWLYKSYNVPEFMVAPVTTPRSDIIDALAQPPCPSTLAPR